MPVIKTTVTCRRLLYSVPLHTRGEDIHFTLVGLEYNSSAYDSEIYQGDINPTAVSYTHLDVYKRQTYTTPH